MIDLTLPWPAVPITALDTETTGIGAGARVCEVAAVRFEGFRPVQRFSTLINPGCPIPAAATAVHGITDDMVKDAPTLTETAVDLFLVCDGAIPLAYNAPFDRDMLHREISGSDCPAFDPAWSWIDVFVMVASARIDKYVSGPGRLKLAAACQRWGVRLDSAHRALGDAAAAGALLFRLFDANLVRPCTVAQLLAHTDKMRLEHEADHAQFRQRLDVKNRRQAVQQELAELFPDADPTPEGLRMGGVK